MDNEVAGSGNINNAEYWEYDTRLGKRWNIDPVLFPWQSSFATFNNDPIYYSDPDGLEATPVRNIPQQPSAPGNDDKGNGDRIIKHPYVFKNKFFRSKDLYHVVTVNNSVNVFELRHDYYGQNPRLMDYTLSGIASSIYGRERTRANNIYKRLHPGFNHPNLNNDKYHRLWLRYKISGMKAGDIVTIVAYVQGSTTGIPVATVTGNVSKMEEQNLTQLLDIPNASITGVEFQVTSSSGDNHYVKISHNLFVKYRVPARKKRVSLW